MTSRCLLHKNKLEDFTAWIKKQGWVEEPTVGDYEVLRARHPSRRIPLLVYDRLDATEHYTTHGDAMAMVHRFLREINGIQKEGGINA